MFPGNSSLAYLMLNATLRRGEVVQFSTKYLLMQIEPNRDYSFEIIKNVKIPAGEYDCTIEARGPQGVLAEESRRVSLEEYMQKPAFEQVPWPVELDEKVSGENMEEVLPKEESIVQKEISNDAAEKEDPVAMANVVSGSANAGASLQASSTLPISAKARFMGSITSKKYHRLDCRYALKIKPENRIYFQSREDAKGQGYLPCKSCNP
ncbi:MAG: Ada metal-binding domain-containing protein [Methanothrix sp.]